MRSNPWLSPAAGRPRASWQASATSPSVASRKRPSRRDRAEVLDREALLLLNRLGRAKRDLLHGRVMREVAQRSAAEEAARRATGWRPSPPSSASPTRLARAPS